MSPLYSQWISTQIEAKDVVATQYTKGQLLLMTLSFSFA